MRSDSPKPGDRVYDLDGREGTFVATVTGGHVVLPIYEGGEGEEYEGDPQTWREVFASAQAQPKIERAVEALTARVQALRKEVSELEAEKRDAERSDVDRLAKMKKRVALRRIEDWIDGRFNLFLEVSEYSSAPRLKTLDEAIKSDDRFSRDQKLVCLFGTTSREFAWRINAYSDGSGGWTTVHPVETEAEAIEIVRKLYADAVATWRAEKRNGSGKLVNWKASGIALSWPDACPSGWIEAPDDVREQIRQDKRNTLGSKVRETESSATAAREALEKFEQENG